MSYWMRAREMVSKCYYEKEYVVSGGRLSGVADQVFHRVIESNQL